MSKRKMVTRSDLIASVGSLASISSLVLYIFRNGQDAAFLAGTIILLIVVLVILLVLSQRRLAIIELEAKYASVIRSIHFYIDQDYRRQFGHIQQSSNDGTDCEHVCRNALGTIVKVFKHTGGAKVRACIKSFETVKKVKTLYTDPDSTIDGDDGHSSGFIADNSDFRSIMKGKVGHFFSNDLSSEPDYQNDSNNWGDRYNSSFVWPIRYWESEHEYIIYGFLCIDSAENGAFREDYDNQVGAVFADLLGTYFKVGGDVCQTWWKGVPSDLDKRCTIGVTRMPWL